MISIRKQLFGLLVFVGVFTIILTAVSVNITLHKEFKNYVEKNIRKTSSTLVSKLETLYEQEGSWDRVIEEEIFTETHIGNFALEILDESKQLVWGMTKEELEEKVSKIDYPIMYSLYIGDSEEKVYIFEDIPMYNKGEIVGYARIGYFPSFLLSSDDMLFQARINKSIIASGLVGLICFACIAGYITRMVTKPIYAIAKTSSDLAGGAYASRYLSKSRIKEVENLRLTTNCLAEKLEQQDHLRKKLISDVSHEIRTPLHVLQSNLEAMIDGIYPIDQQQLEILHREVVRFSSLLNNLNKLKNIEDDSVVLEMRELVLNEELKDAYNTFKILAREKKIKYHCYIKPTHGVVVLADSYALKQVLMNVLSNAFKFTEAGSIRMATETEGKEVRIIIEDTGIGIEADDLPYVFERMYRGDKSREIYEGSGIGLTVVKKLVEIHGGSIDIESKVAQGTRVSIVWPIAHYQKPNPQKTLIIKG